MTRTALLVRFLYGALFLLVLPVLLILWARAAVVPLPAIASLAAGAGLVTLGIALLLAGGAGLMLYGKGLPMNAFPPPLLARRGIFRWLRNPMYLGFVLLSAGVSIAAGSSTGLWLITPTVALAAAALVWGYERHDLVRRFGPTALDPPLLSLSGTRDSPATAAERAAVYLWVLIPWLIGYLAVQAMGRAPDAFATSLPFERRWPVLQWTEVLYFSTYLFVPITPLVIRTARDLRAFAVRGAVATAVVILLWLVVPVVADNRLFVPSGVFGRLLAFEQQSSRGVAAFPAFHVLWSLLAAQAWGSNARDGGALAWRWIGWAWAALITVSCMTTGMHSLIEVAAAGICYLLLRDLEATWALIRRATEAIANSWREWRFGPIRIINHGVWAAAGAGGGVVIAGSAAGSDRCMAIVWLAFCVLAGAGLWAQALEGSSKLLRPFGWYGGVLGGILGTVAARFVAGIPVIALLAALSVAAPWIQLLGRLRCLVQGCCHGGPADAAAGIRYLHRRSRVSQLPSLAGVPLYPTPLYSMAGNMVIGLLLLRLRTLAVSDALLLGVYLILAGIARFVEESYRAEPQTPVLAGLRIYQWLAIVSVSAGAICTTLPAEAVRRSFIEPAAPLLWSAAAVAILYGLAMGMDLPGSNRRFSRLAASD